MPIRTLRSPPPLLLLTPLHFASTYTSALWGTFSSLQRNTNFLCSHQSPTTSMELLFTLHSPASWLLGQEVTKPVWPVNPVLPASLRHQSTREKPGTWPPALLHQTRRIPKREEQAGHCQQRREHSAVWWGEQCITNWNGCGSTWS